MHNRHHTSTETFFGSLAVMYLLGCVVERVVAYLYVHSFAWEVVKWLGIGAVCTMLAMLMEAAGGK